MSFARVLPVALTGLFIVNATALAEEVVGIINLDAEIAAARRNLEQAQSAYRLYVNVEYPRQLHSIDREIVFTRELWETYRRRVTEYERFDRLSYSHPLLVSLQNARLAETDARLRLLALQEERSLLQRTKAERLRLLRLELQEKNACLSRLLISR